MSYQMIETQRDQAAVETLCRALDVSVSGYYAWRQHVPSARQQADERLLADIRALQQAGRGLYGSPRMYQALKKQGQHVSRKRVARLMRQHGLNSRRRRKRRIRTTDSRHHRPVAPNLLARDFSATTPNEKWVGEMD